MEMGRVMCGGDEKEREEEVVASFELLGWYPKRGLIIEASSSSLFAASCSDPFLYICRLQKHVFHVLHRFLLFIDHLRHHR